MTITPQVLWENHYKKFAADFDSMTDDEIESERLEAEYQVEQHTKWLEAVSVWKQIGCPRTPKPEELPVTPSSHPLELTERMLEAGEEAMEKYQNHGQRWQLKYAWSAMMAAAEEESQ